MPANETRPRPPPVPGGQKTASAKARRRSRLHWPTVIFGALPATLMAFPTGAGMLLGLLGGPGGLAVSFACSLWWAATLSLWAVARNQDAIGRTTAVGLLLGIVSTVLYLVLSLVPHRPPVDFIPGCAVLMIIPSLAGTVHLWRFWKNMQADTPARAAPPGMPPPSEKSTRRVDLALRILLFVQVLTCFVFGATLLSGSAGLGGLAIVLMAFPVALAVAVFSVYAFIRYPVLRALAAAVFLAPVVLFGILQSAVRVFGEPAAIAACQRATPWVPLVAILIFPRTADRLVPRRLRGRGACITYCALQGGMLLLFGLILWGMGASLTEARTQSMPAGAMFISLGIAGVACAVLSILGGVAGLLFGYVGLFRPRGERCIGLSITHMILSIALLVIGGAWIWVTSIFLTNPG